MLLHRFFIYTVGKTNSKNDIICDAKLDLRDGVRYLQVGKFTECFSDKLLMWIIKAKENPQNGKYFKNIVLSSEAFLFFGDSENALSVVGTHLCMMKGNVSRLFRHRSCF